MEEINEIKSFLLTPMVLEEQINSDHPISRLKHLSDNSKLISCEDELIKLNSWLDFPDLSTKLIFRGSRDGFTSEAFHEICDGKGPTLTLIKSK